MNIGILELSIDDLNAVSGGSRSRANDPGYHFPYATSFSPNNGSPLYGNGSFKDTIDNDNNLP